MLGQFDFSSLDFTQVDQSLIDPSLVNANLDLSGLDLSSQIPVDTGSVTTIDPSTGQIIGTPSSTDWSSLLAGTAKLVGAAAPAVATLVKTFTGGVAYHPGQVIPAGYTVQNGQLVPISSVTGGLLGTTGNMGILLIAVAALFLLRK